jgi:hypothetical protein
MTAPPYLYVGLIQTLVIGGLFYLMVVARLSVSDAPARRNPRADVWFSAPKPHPERD